MTTIQSTDLDSLRDTWVQLHQVKAELTDLTEITRDLSIDRTQSLVRRAMWLPGAEAFTAVVGLALCLAIPTTTASTVFLSCLVASIVVLAALAMSALWQVVRLMQINAADPVVDTQRALHGAQTHRIWEWKWVLILSPVLWTPFFVVAVEWLVKRYGFDSQVPVFGANFVVVSLLIGGAISLGLHIIATTMTRRVSAKFMQRLLDDLAGRRLVAARSFLDRLDHFEQESPAGDHGPPPDTHG